MAYQSQWTGAQVDHLVKLVDEMTTSPGSTSSSLNGYLYCGIATPSSSPVANFSKVFYLAKSAGTYANFGNLTIYNNSLAVFSRNSAGSWSKTQITSEYSNVLIDAVVDNWTGGDKILFINLIERNDPTRGSGIRVFVSDRDGANEKQAAYWTGLTGTKSGIEQLTPISLVDGLGTITLTVDWDAVPNPFNSVVDNVYIPKKYFKKGILIQELTNQLSSTRSFKYQTVTELPVEGATDTIYLKKKSTPSQYNIYDKLVWIDNISSYENLANVSYKNLEDIPSLNNKPLNGAVSLEDVGVIDAIQNAINSNNLSYYTKIEIDRAIKTANNMLSWRLLNGVRDENNTIFTTDVAYVLGTSRVWLNGMRLFASRGYTEIDDKTIDMSLSYIPKATDELIIEAVFVG